MIQLHHGDALDVLRSMEAGSVNCCVTSPPYWGLRDYGVDGQIGLEQTPEEYVAKLVEVFREVRRVLRDDGTLWLNLGDSYAANRSYQVPSTKEGAKHSPAQGMLGASTVPDGLKPKDLVGIPWMVAFALRADDWYLRSDVIWHKPNPMPESVTDRPTKAHEYLFLLSKSERYFYDAGAIKEASVTEIQPRLRENGLSVVESKTRGGAPNCGVSATRNRRSVWTIATRPYRGAHFATMPPGLVEPCIKAGCPVNGVVLDPFNGAGTTGIVAVENGRRYIGIELNAEYLALTRERFAHLEPQQAALAI